MVTFSYRIFFGIEKKIVYRLVDRRVFIATYIKTVSISNSQYIYKRISYNIGIPYKFLRIHFRKIPFAIAQIRLKICDMLR